ncbi:MAG: hypothetical protein ACFB0B_23015 [Thermonemataceae bacterium]
MKSDFITSEPQDPYLSTFIDYYFYIDITVEALLEKPEYVLPFPRVTFGFFFDHPFLVTNHTLGENKEVNMVISRIATHQVTVLPLSN